MFYLFPLDVVFTYTRYLEFLDVTLCTCLLSLNSEISVWFGVCCLNSITLSAAKTGQTILKYFLTKALSEKTFEGEMLIRS